MQSTQGKSNVREGRTDTRERPLQKVTCLHKIEHEKGELCHRMKQKVSDVGPKTYCQTKPVPVGVPGALRPP